jgi:ribosomal protein S18 acetylase RimI-like enzyme
VDIPAEVFGGIMDLRCRPENGKLRSDTIAPRMCEIAMVLGPPFAMPLRRLPGGFTSRPYRPGDERAWIDIHLATGVYSRVGRDLFEREFGDRRADLLERQLYVIDPEGREVATATLWFPQPGRPPHLGRVHWVAVLPRCQRRGLASALLSELWERMPEFGYSGVYLTTGAGNRPALQLYNSLGFVPLR